MSVIILLSFMNEYTFKVCGHTYIFVPPFYEEKHLKTCLSLNPSNLLLTLQYSTSVVVPQCYIYYACMYMIFSNMVN